MARDLPDYEEFPHVIDAVGGAFAFGAALGAASHFVRGVVRGSTGSGGRLVSGVRAALANAPRVAGKFSAYFLVISVIEYPVVRAQGVEEACIPAVVASLAVSGLVGVRRGGVPAAARYVLFAATGMVMLAEIDWDENVKDGAKCFLQNQMNGSQLATAAVLRPNRRPLWLSMSHSGQVCS